MMRAEIGRYSLILSRARSAVAGNIHSIHPDLCVMCVSVLWQEIAELLYIPARLFTTYQKRRSIECCCCCCCITLHLRSLQIAWYFQCQTDSRPLLNFSIFFLSLFLSPIVVAPRQSLNVIQRASLSARVVHKT